MTKIKSAQDKAQINKRVQARYDFLMERGQHGHYEAMFKCVHEELKLAQAEAWEAGRAAAMGNPIAEDLARQLVAPVSMNEVREECRATVAAASTLATAENARLIQSWHEAQVRALRQAAEKVIEMNRQHANDAYGDADKAENWACVVVLRKALNAAEAEAKRIQHENDNTFRPYDKPNTASPHVTKRP